MTLRAGCWFFVFIAAVSACGDDSDPGNEVVDAAVDASDSTDATADASPSSLIETQRQSCAFGAGAKSAQTLLLDERTRAGLPIKTIIVVMKENRSFDHILGRLHESGQPNAEAVPSTFKNDDLAGKAVAPFRLNTTCVNVDPDHQWDSMHAQVDGGKMDGFVTSAARTTGTDGHFAIGYYDQSDLPFYYWLANTFALADHHFPSVLSGTFPNRNFLLLGTADGVLYTGDGLPDPSTVSIFDLLDKQGVTWGAYSDSAVFDGTLGWDPGHPGTHSFAEFLAAADAGTLPQVVFVDAIEYREDEHPTADVQFGEAWTHLVYEHVVHSPQWPGAALIWTYDEAGGFADHVPPPAQACLARQVDKDLPFRELGIRVPFVMISPWAKAHHVSHTVQDHTAITRFIEAVFDLPALTARDANSTALLEMFDFASAPALLKPPLAPAAGTGGCAGTVLLSTPKPSYAVGEPIVVKFKNGPGTRPQDWIAVYPYPANGPNLPSSTPLLFQYIGGTHTPGNAPAAGSVTLGADSVGGGSWPLSPGLYIAYYLVDGGYGSAASVDFNVQ